MPAHSLNWWCIRPTPHRQTQPMHALTSDLCGLTDRKQGTPTNTQRTSGTIGVGKCRTERKNAYSTNPWPFQAETFGPAPGLCRCGSFKPRSAKYSYQLPAVRGSMVGWWWCMTARLSEGRAVLSDERHSQVARTLDMYSDSKDVACQALHA